MLRIGLTGGIGCGKSTVAEAFAERGVPLIDTDVIAHELTAPGGAELAAIRAHLGDAMLRADGTLDRTALRKRVFADAAARATLESILHPPIRREAEAALSALDDSAAPYVIVVVPLLIETGNYRDLIDRVLVVDCLETQQVARVVARSGMTRADVEAVMAAQSDRAARLAHADDVLTNTADPAALQAQIEPLHRQYLRMAGKQL